jgi:hypothetical protein
MAFVKRNFKDRLLRICLLSPVLLTPFTMLLIR